MTKASDSMSIRFLLTFVERGGKSMHRAHFIPDTKAVNAYLHTPARRRGRNAILEQARELSGIMAGDLFRRDFGSGASGAYQGVFYHPLLGKDNQAALPMLSNANMRLKDRDEVNYITKALLLGEVSPTLTVQVGSNLSSRVRGLNASMFEGSPGIETFQTFTSATISGLRRLGFRVLPMDPFESVPVELRENLVDELLFTTSDTGLRWSTPIITGCNAFSGNMSTPES